MQHIHTAATPKSAMFDGLGALFSEQTVTYTNT